MKNASILSIASLLFAMLFVSQTVSAQWSQNLTTKSITTIANFNLAPNAMLGIGTSTPANAKLDVQGYIGNTIATFRRSNNSRGISIVGDWPGLLLQRNGKINVLWVFWYRKF
jgi:hypothetical protein